MSRAMALEGDSGSTPRDRTASGLTLAFPVRPGSETTPANDTELPSPEVPESVGPYRLLEVLGEGGMGTVYLAEQTAPLNRRVAVKLIRSGRFDRRVLRRFEAERQALARMSHPNVAQVFEAGAGPGGRPYIAMELVPGIPITEYCDRHRLTLAQRLELFAAVCDGVQHAHQKAVLHRDLKPSNILVMENEGKPLPKIIDFGLAKALDEPRSSKLTGDHMVVGTAAYLSPESIHLAGPGRDVDTRSDVYALGVVLYELLVGLRPFEGIGVNLDALRRAFDKELPKPSQRVGEHADSEPEEILGIAGRRLLKPQALRRALRGDLDAIVLKAMARDRSERYGSAAELAEDVRRYLEGEPVLAVPARAAYLLGKFVRRHRAAVAAGVLVTLALTVGFVARSLEAQRANREVERANREAQAARQVADFLTGLFETSAPASPDGRELTARQVLDRGARRIREELGDQPLLRARLMDTMGHVYRSLGHFKEAEALLQESLDLRQRHLGPDDRDVAESLASLATLYRERGDPELAQPLLESAVGIQEGGDDPLALAGYLMELASAENGLGKRDRAEKLLLRALSIREAELGPDHPDVAATLNNLGNLYFDQKRFDEAEKTHRRSLEIKEKALGPDHLHVAQSLNNLSNVYKETGRYAEAEPLQRRALMIKRKILDPNHVEIGVSLHNLGDLTLRRDDLEKADAYFRQSLEIWRQTLPQDHPYRILSLQGLAQVARKRGAYAEAVDLSRQSLEIALRAFPADHPVLGELKAEHDNFVRVAASQAPRP